MFRENLQKLVERLTGGIGGVVMGFDGIAVESYMRNAAAEVDVQAVIMEFAHLVGQTRRTARSVNLGALRELTLRTEKITLIIHVLSDEYFVACAVSPTESAGKARYLVRMVAPQLQAELAS